VVATTSNIDSVVEGLDHRFVVDMDMSDRRCDIVPDTSICYHKNIGCKGG